MPITYGRNGDGTGTVTISFTNNQAKLETFIQDLAESLYQNFEGVEFSSLSDQEKLDLVESKIRTFFIARVKSIREQRATDALVSPEL